MGAICSCGRYSQYVIDHYADGEDGEDGYITGVEPMVQQSSEKIVYKGSGGSGSGGGEHRSLEKLVEGGLIEADIYLMFKNITIRELGIVRVPNKEIGPVVEFEGDCMSLTKFCKKAAAKHGKTWNGTPWNCVYTIDGDDEPLMRIDRLWESMKTQCEEEGKETKKEA